VRAPGPRDGAADPASAKVGVDEHGRFIGRGRALVSGGRGEQDDSPALEALKGIPKADGAVQGAEGMSGPRQPGDRVQRELGAEGDDEVAGAQRLAAHHHLPEARVDSLDLSVDDLDALALEAIERTGNLSRRACPAHDPEERRGQRE